MTKLLFFIQLKYIVPMPIVLPGITTFTTVFVYMQHSKNMIILLDNKRFISDEESGHYLLFLGGSRVLKRCRSCN